MNNKTDKPWETTIILGDNGLAKILGVNPRTVLEWRKAGKITGRPLGIMKDGKPRFYTYTWEKVRHEIKNNVNLIGRIKQVKEIVE